VNNEVECWKIVYQSLECWKIVYQSLDSCGPFQAAEEKKDDRSRLAAIIREVDRFLSDGLVKVFHPAEIRQPDLSFKLGKSKKSSGFFYLYCPSLHNCPLFAP
jgi:hypothetical protein